MCCWLCFVWIVRILDQRISSLKQMVKNLNFKQQIIISNLKNFASSTRTVVNVEKLCCLVVNCCQIWLSWLLTYKYSRGTRSTLHTWDLPNELINPKQILRKPSVTQYVCVNIYIKYLQLFDNQNQRAKANNANRLYTILPTVRSFFMAVTVDQGWLVYLTAD